MRKPKVQLTCLTVFRPANFGLCSLNDSLAMVFVMWLLIEIPISVVISENSVMWLVSNQCYWLSCMFCRLSQFVDVDIQSDVGMFAFSVFVALKVRYCSICSYLLLSQCFADVGWVRKASSLYHESLWKANLCHEGFIHNWVQCKYYTPRWIKDYLSVINVIIMQSMYISLETFLAVGLL